MSGLVTSTLWQPKPPSMQRPDVAAGTDPPKDTGSGDGRPDQGLTYKLNNNIGESDKCSEYVCQGSGNEGHDLGVPCAVVGRDNSEGSAMCQTGGPVALENGASEVECSTGSAESGRGDSERCKRQQHEPPGPEINTRDVTASRDPAAAVTPENTCKSNSKHVKEPRRGRGESSCSSTCSAGSYSRRQHHKHKRRARSPRSPAPVSPKVNPIFLWVRQEDTRIVEVMCEDYDHRNRIRLAKTPLGWRAIPKTDRFAAAVIPKVTSDVPKTERVHRKRKKAKRKKSRRPHSHHSKETVDNPVIRECSVSLSKDNLCAYETRRDTSCESRSSSRSRSRSAARSVESLGSYQVTVHKLLKMPKSHSCEFTALPDKVMFKRSSSMEDLLEPLAIHPQVQIEETKVEHDDLVSIKDEPLRIESTKNAAKIDLSEIRLEGLADSSLDREDLKEFSSQRNSSDSIMDMTRHDSDCDELGQLLKDIPDLEFVHEEDLEQVDEDDTQLSLPTDLTLPKTKHSEESIPRVKLPLLPANISSLVTVTSSSRAPEPLTAPLPEVTITPIPNPKPAHQQKPQNKFLESLLSTPHFIKPDRDEITITRTSAEKRPLLESPLERRGVEKRCKVEDITLKSLLSKHSDKSLKQLDLESCVRKMKGKQETESGDCPKSRLQELLTERTAASQDPIAQLKQVLSNPELSVPDPLLVPRARLPALVASPASEIPRLLSLHLDKKLEEPMYPDMLVVSLSHLQSLLSYSPDKKKGAEGSSDVAAYQKSLEAFLEWQRYQTELMEAQMKMGATSGDMDMATASALNQMLWLPYLNQLECNGNRELMGSLLNSMLSHGYPPPNLTAPPHISTNHFPQSSPFLTPTSPMDVESQMKTLAMWQEAVMAQQSAHSRVKQDGRIKVPHVPPPTSARKQQRLSPLPSPQKTKGANHFPLNQKNYGYEAYQAQMQQIQQAQMEYQRKQQHQQKEFQLQQQRQMELQQQRQMEMQHQRQMELQRQQQEYLQFQQMQQSYANYQEKQFKGDIDKRSRTASISVKPLSNLMDKSNNKRSASWQKFEEDLKKSAELTNQMALRWQQFEEEMRKSQIQISKNQKKVKTEVADPWSAVEDTKPHPLPQLQPVEEKSGQEKPVGAPKLKVKNLVDPNMSPPKLLKQIAPEHLPVDEEHGGGQDDSQAHLWHPLFGSNQIRGQSYSSPWRWTTVTVNGE